SVILIRGVRQIFLYFSPKLIIEDGLNHIPPQGRALDCYLLHGAAQAVEVGIVDRFFAIGYREGLNLTFAGDALLQYDGFPDPVVVFRWFVYRDRNQRG